MKKTIFTGSGVAIATPMRADLSIDFEELGKLIDFQLENGTDAIIICGTTGESATMTDQEHMDSITFAVKHVAGRVPVIAGTGSNDTAYAVWMSKHAEKAGADALLVVTPYYNKCTQKGLIAHFSAIAEATSLPIILYNVPSRTGVDIKPSTYLELSKIPNIVAVKEANGNLSSVAQTRALCGDALEVYSGNDDQIVPIMSLGGKGVISVLANVAPRATHEIAAACLAGDYPKAAEMQLKYIPLINALFSEVNPIPVKEALNQMGFACGPCRLPMTPMEDANKVLLTDEMKKAGLL